MMYEAVIPIRVTFGNPAVTLGDAIDEVTNQLALIDEYSPALLDYAVSSDATDNTAVFKVNRPGHAGRRQFSGPPSRYEGPCSRAAATHRCCRRRPRLDVGDGPAPRHSTPAGLRGASTSSLRVLAEAAGR